MDSPNPKYRSIRKVANLGTIPLLLGVSPLVGLGMGYLLDRWLGTGMILKLVFTGLGFAAGVREMLRLLAQSRRDRDDL